MYLSIFIYLYTSLSPALPRMREQKSWKARKQNNIYILLVGTCMVDKNKKNTSKDIQSATTRTITPFEIPNMPPKSATSLIPPSPLHHLSISPSRISPLLIPLHNRSTRLHFRRRGRNRRLARFLRRGRFLFGHLTRVLCRHGRREEASEAF